MKAIDKQLFDAITKKDTRLVAKALDEGANPNATNPDKADLTALVHACMHYEKRVVDLLVNKGANVNLEGAAETPLTIAASLYNQELADYLLQKKAEINCQLETGDGRTALHAVAVSTDNKKQQKAMYEFLVKRGANPNIRDAFGQTPAELLEEMLGGEIEEDRKESSRPKKKVKREAQAEDLGEGEEISQAPKPTRTPAKPKVEKESSKGRRK